MKFFIIFTMFIFFQFDSQAQFQNLSFWRKRPPVGPAVTESFETWSAGIPVGWTFGYCDGYINQTTANACHGTYAIEGYRECAIQKTFDLTGKTSLKIDANATNCAGNIPQGYVTIDTTTYTINTMGTNTFNISAFTGNKNITILIGGEYNPVNCKTWMDKLIIE